MAADLSGRGVGTNQVAEFLVEDENLEDTYTAFVAGPVASGAADGNKHLASKFRKSPRRQTGGELRCHGYLIPARAKPPDEPLRDDRSHRGRNQR